MDIRPESGCTAGEAGGQPKCAYDATINGGIGGYSSEPGGWTVTITGPGELAPIVVRSFGGGAELCACGTIRPGDHVVASAKPGARVTASNPGICF
jgi:hypothetical protein